EYQKTGRVEARQRLAAQLQKAGVAFDELGQLIQLLPPPEPYPVAAVRPPVVAGLWLAGAAVATGGSPVAAAVATGVPSLAPPGTTLLRLNTELLPPSLTTSRRRGIAYALQLPPEYHHGRPWPVLFVLHNAGEKPQDIVARWGPWAARFGYV